MQSHQVHQSVTPHNNDILVDGFLAQTFSPRDAHAFFTLLLRTSDFLRYYRVSYSRGVWYIMQNAPLPTQHPPLALDFDVNLTQGRVVPQPRWTPNEDVDVRRHVRDATLQLPIFFVNGSGEVGFWLPDILQGGERDLYNKDCEALLGGVTTTHVRINWPGYGSWKRQIPARDETYYRNPITIGRLMRHVGTSVDKFLNKCATANGTEPSWRIGPHNIMQHHIRVIGVVHISAGSWMPIIQLTYHAL